MEKQYYGIMGKKGRIEIPEEIKNETGIEKNDVIRICRVGNLIILEKVNLKDKDISKKIESMLDIEHMPLETFQAYVLTTIKKMENDELFDIDKALSKSLRNSGLNYNNWTAKLLVEFVKNNFDKTIAVNTAYNTFHKLNYSKTRCKKILENFKENLCKVISSKAFNVQIIYED